MISDRTLILLTVILWSTIIAPACFAQKAPLSDTTSIETYNKLVSRYRYDKPDSALFLAQKGMALAKKQHNLDGQAMMLNQLGMIDDNVGRYADSRKKYLSALDLYTQTGNNKGMSAVNIRLGVVEMRKGNYDKATGYFLEALDISEKSGNPLGKMEANLTLGEAYFKQKKFDEALNYYHVAESLNSRLPFSNLSLNLLVDLGAIYRDMGRFEEAKAHLTRGLVPSNVPQYQGLNITLTTTLASVYTKEGNKNKSIELQKLALEKARRINNYIRQVQILNGLAATYGTGNANEALAYYKQAVVLAQGKDDYKQVTESLNNMADLYNFQKNYKAAFDIRSQQYAIADKYFYKEMSKQITSLQSEYELNQSKVKVQELSFLNKQQSFERKVILLVMTGALMLLIVVAVFLYRTSHLNRLLHRTNASLQDSNQVKDKLFSILGHDLRAPFVSVINLMEFIDDDDISPQKRKELMGLLLNTSNASLETLNNLLKWGEMQIKGVRLNQTTFAIKSNIDRTIAMLADTATYKSIIIENDVSDDVTVFADADHFDFVIRNLISNAIKFSYEKGTITISVNIEPDGNMVTIIVQDRGVGIPASQVNQIFNINNISTSGTNNEKGTSIGLLLCKEFVELNGGIIQVESEEGKGSAFKFSLHNAQVI
ncbi:tetratricopeptide repeat-containing sensor histidine kinase [Mucilaginibacter mali]|uniref:histidine kinase n=1 Tax=Mucilaginibacter mali TaxID=2740462 RepID=A0A7D4UD98_9SPHI|nr:tetratricopeptide repeat protein [Mucilaginibacter mali]QKJ30339.1 tetratricopeptide repeat-containing sensor histidine kinase [Mucilaginibacter mali]